MRSIKIGGIFLVFTALVSCESDAVSLVYNIKVRRALRLGETVRMSDLLGEKKDVWWIFSAAPMLYKRTRHIVDTAQSVDVHEKRLIGGMVFNLRCSLPHGWWLDTTTGLEREHADSCGTFVLHEGRGGIDDLVFTAGNNLYTTDKVQLSAYGLSGIPTKRKVTAQERYDTFVGSRLFSVGIGGEVSYSFINELERSLVTLIQTRCLHFLNRHWQPILPECGQIQPGNGTDLVLATQYRHKRNVFEAGYNATFFTNQAVLVPGKVTKSDTFVRNSAYATVTRLCKELKFFDHQMVFGGGFYLARAKKFDTKIGSCWLNMAVVF